MGAAHVDFLVPDRFKFGYGLTPEIVDVAVGMQPDLIITVDNGIASNEGVDAARKNGIDVLITVNRYTEQHDFTGAAVVLDHLGEPAMPCHMIQGDLAPATLVDTEYLRRLHAHCQAARR